MTSEREWRFRGSWRCCHATWHSRSPRRTRSAPWTSPSSGKRDERLRFQHRLLPHDVPAKPQQMRLKARKELSSRSPSSFYRVHVRVQGASVELGPPLIFQWILTQREAASLSRVQEPEGGTHVQGDVDQEAVMVDGRRKQSEVLALVGVWWLASSMCNTALRAPGQREDLPEGRKKEEHRHCARELDLDEVVSF